MLVKRINAFGVHFDFKPGATLAALFSRHPDLQHMYSAPVTQSELSAEVVCRGLVYASLLELMACPLVVVQDGSHATGNSGSAGRSVMTGTEYVPFTVTTPHYVADLAWSWPIESQAVPRDQHSSQSPPMSWPPAAPPAVSHQQAIGINQTYFTSSDFSHQEQQQPQSAPMFGRLTHDALELNDMRHRWQPSSHSAHSASEQYRALSQMFSSSSVSSPSISTGQYHAPPLTPQRGMFRESRPQLPLTAEEMERVARKGYFSNRRYKG